LLIRRDAASQKNPCRQIEKYRSAFARNPHTSQAGEFGCTVSSFPSQRCRGARRGERIDGQAHTLACELPLTS